MSEHGGESPQHWQEHEVMAQIERARVLGQGQGAALTHFASHQGLEMPDMVWDETPAACEAQMLMAVAQGRDDEKRFG